MRAIAVVCALVYLAPSTHAARDKIRRQVLDLNGRKIELAFASDTSKNGFAHGDAELRKEQAKPLNVQFTTNAYTIMPGPLEVYPGNNVLLVMPGEENCTLVFSNDLKNEEHLQRGEGLRTHSTEGKKTRLSAERMDVETGAGRREYRTFGAGLG
jgi:hypothetical protein